MKWLGSGVRDRGYLGDVGEIEELEELLDVVQVMNPRRPPHFHLSDIEVQRVGFKASVLNLWTTTSQKCEAVPKRARIQGS